MVFYQIKESSLASPDNEISTEDRYLLNEKFIEITEDGRILEGLSAFADWCRKRKLPLAKSITECLLTLEKYNKYRDQYGLIDGIEKIKNTKGMNVVYLKSLYYLDFYAIERFGKTLMGQLLHFAKQGQNK